MTTQHEQQALVTINIVALGVPILMVALYLIFG